MNTQYAKQLAGIFSSLTIITMGGVNIFTTLSVDYSTMLYLLVQVLPIAIIMGFLGYSMGKILGNPKRQRKRRKSNAKA